MSDRINISLINNAEQPKLLQSGKTSFRGAGGTVLSGLNMLNSSPALGACCVDLCSMVIPRTAIELKNRGTQAGIEAGVREGSSCLINASVGLIGMAAAALLSGNFNKKYSVKAQNIFASRDTVKNMSELWQNSKGDSKQFFNGFVQNIKGLNGSEWKCVSDGTKDEIVDKLINLADKTKQMSAAKGAKKNVLKKEAKELKNSAVSMITKSTGAKNSFKLQAVKDSKEICASLPELVDNAVSLSNAFKTTTKDTLPSFVNALAKNKTRSTALGILLCSALCMSIQPINRYLTKKRTGQDGFVGVDTTENDNSKGFKAAKTIAGIAFPTFAIKTAGGFKNLPSKLQFNSKIPTINQFKVLYGLTIGSRLLAARDSNELREGLIKDSLGFTNWLILGGMVSKLTARALGGKELINNPVKHQGGKKGIKYAAQWLGKSSVKSFDEVLLPEADEIMKNGKLMKFSEIFNNAAPCVKSKVIKIACSQLAGYLYSGLILGLGISKLNIFITKQVHEKQKADKNMNKTISEAAVKNIDMDYIAKMNNSLSHTFEDFD